MRTPPLLMAAALLFWGWETGMLFWSLLLAAALEGSRLTRSRWELSDTDLNRISDLCWVLLVGAALLLYSSEDRLSFIFKLTQRLPFCFFPLIVAQAYGNRATMPLTVFSWLLRRVPASPVARKSYNISYAYFAFCLLAASATMRANSFFYAGITLLVALALSSIRPRRVSLPAWITLLLLVATVGQFSSMELKRAQDSVERVLGSFIAGLMRNRVDSQELQTKIGRKWLDADSEKIILRVRPAPGGFVPPLLRQATWDAYKGEIWSVSNADFGPVRTGSDDSVKLLPTNMLASAVEIAGYYDGGQGKMPMPQGTDEINDMSAPATVKTNRLGDLMMEEGPGLLVFQSVFGPGRSIDAPPTARDLAVQPEEQPALAAVISQLKLDGMTERQKIRAIERYFVNNHFHYSLNPPDRRSRPKGQTWLAYFLQVSHAGHCQYFATATVLLLRQAGISARFETGYVVPESARHGDTYLVRGRDAHAWTLVYHSDTGVWEDIDTTPTDWSKAGAGKPPWWEPVNDALSNLYFDFSKWRWSKTSYARYSTWAMIPVILYLIARIVLDQRRRRRPAGPRDASSPAAWPGADSELYLIDRQLAAAQLSRLPNEPLLLWQQRLEAAFPDSDRLRRIFDLHRSLRFDPIGLHREDRDTLRREAQQWLAEFTARMAREKQTAPPGPLPVPG